MMKGKTVVIAICLGLAVLLAWPGTIGAAERLVNLDFQEAPIVQVFQSLADMAGLNILADESVKGTVTFSLRGVPVLEAIDLIAKASGYRYHISGKTLIVATEERLRSEFLPSDYEIVQLTDVDLERAQQLVEQLVPDVEVYPDEGTNSLIVRGTDKDVKEAVDFLHRYDTTKAQNLNFVSAPVDRIIRTLASRAGWNLVVAGTIEGDLTASLDGMEPTEALDLISEAANLRYQLTGKVLYIRQLERAGDKPTTKIFRLGYSAPAKTQSLLTMVEPDVKTDIDETSSSIVVEGTELQVEQASRFIKQFDVPRPQVLVEARIEEISVDAMRELGIEWNIPRSVNVSPQTMSLTWNVAELSAVLNALDKQERSKVLASPKIAALHGETANIMIGDKVPLVTRAYDDQGRVTENVEYLDIGIRLKITPRIANDDFVTLQLETEVSSLTNPGADFPQMRTRNADTLVRVKDGQPLVIGGLIQDSETKAMQGLPFLSDLPIVGSLFRKSKNANDQSETVIFLIPHIVNYDEPSTGATSASEHAAAAQRTGGAAVGSSVSEALSFPGAKKKESSVAVDMTSLLAGAVDVDFEGRSDAYDLLTRAYLARDNGGLAWGLGFGMRYYGGGAEWRPWVDVVAEYLQHASQGDGHYLLSARLGGRALSDGDALFLEPYAQYTLGLPDAGPQATTFPGRRQGFSGGMRLGWAF